MLKLLDSRLIAIPDPDPGRNDVLKGFQTSYEAIEFINNGISPKRSKCFFKVKCAKRGKRTKIVKDVLD